MHVVNMDVVLEHAYDWGYDEFVDIEVNPDTQMAWSGRARKEPEDVVREYDPYMITDSARYANIILPGLRQMSGYADAGAGTYAYTRDVVAVDGEVAYQYVTDADEVASSELLDEVVSEFFNGANDALANEKPKVSP